MSKSSYDVLEFLRQHKSQTSASESNTTPLAPPRLTRSPSLRLPVIISAPNVLYDAVTADADVESIYSEEVSMPLDLDDEVRTIPGTPNISPIEPSSSSTTIDVPPLNLSASETTSRVGNRLDRTIKKLDFSAKTREVDAITAPTAELASSVPLPTFTTETFQQKRPARLEPLQRSSATEPIHTVCQSAPGQFPEPPTFVPHLAIVPRPALSNMERGAPDYTSLSYSARGGYFVAWGKETGRAATALPRATQQSRIILSPLVRRNAPPPVTLSELLLEPQQIPGQATQDQKQLTPHLTATIRHRF